MANVQIKDGASATKYMKTDGAGTNADPYVPHHVLDSGSVHVTNTPSVDATGQGDVPITLDGESVTIQEPLTVDTTGTSGLEVVQDTAGDLNVTEASASAIKTAVEIIDNAISGSEMLIAGGATQSNDVKVTLDSEVVSVDATGQGDVPITLDGESVAVSSGSVDVTNTVTVDASQLDIDDLDKASDSVGVWSNTAKDGSGTDYQPLLDADGHLQVDILSGGGSGGTAMTDDDTFTPASNSFTPVGGMLDDTAPDSISEGDAGVFRMSANRNLYTTIRDAAGNERGANVDASGNLNVTFDSGSVSVTNDIDINDISKGTQTNDVKVTLDGETVSVDDNAGSLTVDQGTHDNLNLNANLQVGDSDVADGNPVPVSDAGGALTVDGTVTANLSATDNTVLDNIDSNTDYGAVTGGGVEASALRVTIANDSTGVVSVDDDGGSLTVDGTVAVSSGSVDITNTITETNSSAIKTAVETIDNAISGNEILIAGGATQSNDVKVTLDSESVVLGASDGTDIGDVDVASMPNDTFVAEDGALGKGVLIQGDDGTDRHNVAVDVSGRVQVDIAEQSDASDLKVTLDGEDVVSGTADNFKADANLQVGDTDVADGNPVPVSDAGGSLTVDGTVSISSGSVDITNTITETNSSAIKTAVETIDNAISGSEILIAGGATQSNDVKVTLDSEAVVLGASDGTDIGDVDVASQPARDRATDNVGVALQTDAIMNDTTVLTPKFASIDVASSGSNSVVSAVAGKKIRMLQCALVTSGSVSVQFKDGAGGSNLTGDMDLAAAGNGFVLPFSLVGWLETSPNTLLNLYLSSATAVDGCLTYVEV